MWKEEHGLFHLRFCFVVLCSSSSYSAASAITTCADGFEVEQREGKQTGWRGGRKRRAAGGQREVGACSVPAKGTLPPPLNKLQKLDP